ncbi:hypothetical protein VM1G_09377 [Cytospora mali]|uniref:Cyanovirin-N domain-containing protein n=1 Tax=Cytospora mali TaxID=578113 RepID=A0A194WCC4_CYTMA|nr:hypothetical protein VM1G_09377 [Valsa mali]
MSKTKVTHVLGLLGSLLIGRAAASSGFSKSCDEIIVGSDGSTVEAKCVTTSSMGPPWVCTKLDLNQCLGNYAGRLTPKDGGDFTQTCESCGEADSLIIGCQCWTGAYSSDGSKVYHYSEYDLDDVVGNSDGYLECFGNIAPKSSGCS